MLYLLDANVLITANSAYYPLDQVPEFWTWILHQATSNRLKIPREIMDEIKAGRKDDDPYWIGYPVLKSKILWCSKRQLMPPSFNTLFMRATHQTFAMTRLRKLAAIRFLSHMHSRT
jgi:hypothetical protein